MNETKVAPAGGAWIETREQFRKEYFDQAKEAGYQVNGQMFIALEKDLYIAWLENKIDDPNCMMR